MWATARTPIPSPRGPQQPRVWRLRLSPRPRSHRRRGVPDPAHPDTRPTHPDARSTHPTLAPPTPTPRRQRARTCASTPPAVTGPSASGASGRSAPARSSLQSIPETAMESVVISILPNTIKDPGIRTCPWATRTVSGTGRTPARALAPGATFPAPNPVLTKPPIPGTSTSARQDPREPRPLTRRRPRPHHFLPLADPTHLGGRFQPWPCWGDREEGV